MNKITLYEQRNMDYSTYFSLNKLDSYVVKILSSVKSLSELSDYIPKEIKYFANPLKQNLVNWINFNSGDEILLVNDAFGIMAETLCTKVKNVTISESSNVLANITKARLSEIDNIDFNVASSSNQDILNKKYDCIILTDILELAQSMISQDFSKFNYLAEIKKLLKPEGKLIINISNQFGIKNWAGAVDEHFGKIYASLKNYSGTPIKLLSETEINELLEQNGFKNIQNFYPVPSHYCPKRIISKEEKIEKEVAKYFQNYALYFSKPLFDERIVMEDIISNDKFHLFVNSYMFIAEKGEDIEHS